MPACDEKNWPTQLALEGAAACADPVTATATAVAAMMAPILGQLRMTEDLQRSRCADSTPAPAVLLAASWLTTRAHRAYEPRPWLGHPARCRFRFAWRERRPTMRWRSSLCLEAIARTGGSQGALGDLAAAAPAGALALYASGIALDPVLLPDPRALRRALLSRP